MNEIKHNHHQHGGQDREGVHHSHSPYWKRVHHDWRFWVAVFLMFAAMLIYVMSDDLAWRPRIQPQQPRSSAVKK